MGNATENPTQAASSSTNLHAVGGVKKPLRSCMFLAVGFVFFGGAVVAFLWLSHQANVATTSHSGPMDEITIGNVGEYSIFNLIARDEGYFKQNNLRANIIEYPSGPPAVTDLLAGKVNFAIAADFVGVTNIFQNPDLRILAQTSQQTSFGLIARKDKGISDPRDLKGKRVGVTKNGAGEFFLGQFLIVNGMSPSDISEVNLQPAALINGLNSGQLDAIVIFEPYVYNLTSSLGDKIIYWNVQGQQKTLAFSYTTKTYLRSHAAIVNRYVKSLVEAENFLTNNDTASRKLLAKDLQYSPAYVDYLWPKIDFHLSLAQPMLLYMEDEARFVIAGNVTAQKTVPNYLDYIYFPALQSAAPQEVTIIH